MPAKTTFSWRNYTRPTPKNLKKFMEFWRGGIVLITANSIDKEWPEWLSISILFFGYVIDQLSEFFGQVEEDEAKSTVTVEFPAKMREEVVIKEETKAPEVKDGIVNEDK